MPLFLIGLAVLGVAVILFLVIVLRVQAFVALLVASLLGGVRRDAARSSRT